MCTVYYMYMYVHVLAGVHLVMHLMYEVHMYILHVETLVETRKYACH